VPLCGFSFFLLLFQTNFKKSKFFFKKIYSIEKKRNFEFLAQISLKKNASENALSVLKKERSENARKNGLRTQERTV